MWFSKTHLEKRRPKFIITDDLHGLVLPHAGTKYTGRIVSHTLRFKPKKQFRQILILYYPAMSEPNVTVGSMSYYHEYYVVWKIMELACKWWNIKHNIQFIGVNVAKETVPELDLNNTFFIVSADFSHYLPLSKALPAENCAAHSIMQRQLSHRCTKVIDHIKTFKVLNNIIPSNWVLQWVGRTRSRTGFEGVGYLSFLLREAADPRIYRPDGYFITAYDNRMTQRECLGKWFNQEGTGWTQRGENIFLKKVINLAATSSRLTGGRGLSSPITNYTITYLYRERRNQPFIRGWHGISYGAFYLPDVMLENTFDNGKWITNLDVAWPSGDTFNMNDTLISLRNKAGGENIDYPFSLYNTRVFHGTL